MGPVEDVDTAQLGQRRLVTPEVIVIALGCRRSFEAVHVDARSDYGRLANDFQFTDNFVPTIYS